VENSILLRSSPWMTANVSDLDTQPDNQQPGWGDWVRVALIGSSRAELPASLRDLLTAQGLCSAEEGEAEQILLAAGSQPLLQRAAAGFYQTPLPPAAPTELPAKITPAAIRLLDTILSGQYPLALREYLHIIVKYQQPLPPERLPDLLALDVRQEITRQLLEKAIGSRGRWLLQEQQASQQRALSPLAALTAHWRKLREQQPADARLLLANQWPGMPPAERSAALSTLETGLSMDDEPWLESCLDDTRKEVRMVAAAMLQQLPESRLCLRMFDRLNPCLRLSGNNVWQLSLPTRPPKESERDGIYPTGSKLPGGLPFSWFEQQLACVSPTRWEQLFCGLTPAQLLAGAVAHPQAERICRALIIATNRYPNEPWAIALLTRLINETLPIRFPDKSVEELLEKAPLKTFEQLIGQWLATSPEEGIIPADHPVHHWLLTSPHPWPANLASLFWKGFMRMAAKAGMRAWSYGHYKSLLVRCSYHAPVQMFDIFKRDWQLAAAGFGAWNADVQQLLQVFAFRKEMRNLLSVDKQL
jgi:hypothetical protein